MAWQSAPWLQDSGIVGNLRLLVACAYCSLHPPCEARQECCGSLCSSIVRFKASDPWAELQQRLQRRRIVATCFGDSAGWAETAACPVGGISHLIREPELSACTLEEALGKEGPVQGLRFRAVVLQEATHLPPAAAVAAGPAAPPAAGAPWPCLEDGRSVEAGLGRLLDWGLASAASGFPRRPRPAMAAAGKENRVKHLVGFSQEDAEGALTTTAWQLLVRIVKECQKRQARGSQGTWQDFLAATVDRDRRASQVARDPARRPWRVLAAFVETLVAEADVKASSKFTTAANAASPNSAIQPTDLWQRVALWRQLVERIRKWDRAQRRIAELEVLEPWPITPAQELVLRTRRHPAYEANFNFQPAALGLTAKWDAAGVQEWVHTKRGSPAADAPDHLLSIDCEMAVIEGQARELVRVAVIDQAGEVLLSELVKPSKPVIDYKTAITGVTAADFKSITFTQQDAQSAVKRLLTPGTILIGHGLHHDLRALRIDHRRVIDTALLFCYEGLANAVPALGDLCRAVLEEPFREGSVSHDSVEDATVPMKLVLHELKHGPTATLKAPSHHVDKAELAKLYIHRVPHGVSPHILATIFPKDTSCHIQDALGRAQKVVSLTAEAGTKEEAVEVVVRKMGCHNGLAFGVDGRKGAAFGLSQGSRQTAVAAAASKPAAPAGGHGSKSAEHADGFSLQDAEEEDSGVVEAVSESPRAESPDGAVDEGGGGLEAGDRMKRGWQSEDCTQAKVKKRRKSNEGGANAGDASASQRKRRHSEGHAQADNKRQQASRSSAAPDEAAAVLLNEGARQASVPHGSAAKQHDEVERLRHELAERSAEVVALQRLVTELAMRQAP
eukprot:SM000054S18035  [mRNA]  locus=s54:52121:57313:+ [translate_table: standard]